MASITKRGPYQFQAQIRRRGYPTQQRTFETKRDAEAWATAIESEMHRGVFLDRSEAERTTFGEALDRYAGEVTSGKRGWETEMYRINALKSPPLQHAPWPAYAASTSPSTVTTARRSAVRRRLSASWSLFPMCSTLPARTGRCRLRTRLLTSANRLRGSIVSAAWLKMSYHG